MAQMAVFARVEPSHKQRLVELLKAQVSSQLSGGLSSAGCSQQLTVEALLWAKVLCGRSYDTAAPQAPVQSPWWPAHARCWHDRRARPEHS